MQKHIQAMKRKDGSSKWMDTSIYELLSAIMQATGCNKKEAGRKVNWIAEEHIDVHVNGTSYALQEVF